MGIINRLLGREISYQVRPDIPQLTRAELFSKLAELAKHFRKQNNASPSSGEITAAVFKQEGQYSTLFYALDDSDSFQDLCRTAVMKAAVPESSVAEVLATFEAVWKDYAEHKLPAPSTRH